MTPDPVIRKESDEFGEQILTKVVKAGRRTYFFDVRATRGDDYFVTITESRKTTREDGTAQYHRKKLFLFKEDFSKFGAAFQEVVDFVRHARPETADERVEQREPVAVE